MRKSIVFSLFLVMAYTLSMVQMNTEVKAETYYPGYEYLGQYEAEHDDYDLPVKINVYRSYSISSYQCLAVDDVPSIPPRIDHMYGDVGDTIFINEGSSSEDGYLLDLSFGVGAGVGVPMLVEASTMLTYSASRTWTTFIQEGTNVTFEIDEYAESGTYELQKCNNYRKMKYEIYYPVVLEEGYYRFFFFPIPWVHYIEPVWGYDSNFDLEHYYAAQNGTFYRLIKFADLPY